MRATLLALALMSALAVGCNSATPSVQNAAQPQAVTAVDTVAVASRNLDTQISLPAQLLPYESVDIYPRVTGFLDSIRVDVGSRVRKGEELMRISAPELVAQNSRAEAAMHAAESQLASA